MQPFTKLTSTVAVLPLANIDTDQIIPAAYLKGTDRSGLAAGLFAHWRFGPDGRPDPAFALNRPGAHEHRILLAGDNFGCGSSREHAPWALVEHGFRAVVSTRFADIFGANAVRNGLLPASVTPEAHATLAHELAADPTTAVTIDLAALELRTPRTVHRFTVDPFGRRCLLDGVDQLGFLLAQAEAVSAYERRHTAPFDTRRAGGTVGRGGVL